MKIQSTFAILDVKGGRDRLTKLFEGRPRMGPCPENMRVPVTIVGYIDSIHGNDDGESREFNVTVERVDVRSAAPVLRLVPDNDGDAA
ncbi:hypothetical protein [Amorphus sp. MBR-141]